MKKGTPLYYRLDEYNKIIMNPKNIDIKVDDNYQALILLSLLSDFFANFTNSMLYGRDTISLAEVSLF
jgi:hypothetical protein